MLDKTKGGVASTANQEGETMVVTATKSIPTTDIASTKEARVGVPIFDTDAMRLQVMDAYSAKVDGKVTQQALADSFKAFYNGMFAYDWENGQWYRYAVRRWSAIRSIGREIAVWTAQVMLEAGISDTAKWQNAATYAGVETILKQTLTVDWNQLPGMLAFSNGFALNTEDATVETTYARYFINQYLPDAVNGDMSKVNAKWDGFVFDALAHYDLADRLAIKKYMQQWAGSALTGDCRDEAMLFLHGLPGTGKSTFVETIGALFGMYGASVQGSRVAKEGNGHLQWLAGLDGKRFVAIHELPERGAWQSDTMNQLVSGGVVEANRMRQDSFNFQSIAHVIATGNHRPRAAAGSGIWRRMAIVEFQNKPTTPDKTLKVHFLANLPGIMAWAMQGLDEWLAAGRELVMPDVLIRERTAYQQDAAPVAQFMAERLMLGEGVGPTSVNVTYDAYVEWAAEIGVKAQGKKGFGVSLDELGLPRSYTRGKERVRDNVALMPV